MTAPPGPPALPDAPDGAGARWADAAHAARLLAVDPAGLGGVWLRARPGPARDRWLALLRAALPADAPLRRLPAGTPDSRLLGGLDLPGTLRAGRPVIERGVLACCDGGAAVLAMAERLPSSVAGRIAAALDLGEVVLERDGLATRLPARLGIVALDEGTEDEAPPPGALVERLGLWLDLDGISHAGLGGDHTEVEETPADADSGAARGRLPEVRASDEAARALCAAAEALGIGSLRAPLLALRAAHAAAALAGRDTVSAADVALAARLVLGPRATVLPVPAPPEEAAAPVPESGAHGPDAPDDGDGAQAQPPAEPDRTGQALDEVVLAAAKAAVPARLLGSLKDATPARHAPSGPAPAGRSGQVRRGPAKRGVPVGTIPGKPRPGARVSLVETLRAAAPWQRLRRGAGEGAANPPQRPLLRPEDVRLVRFKEHTATTAVFVVDASGSAALHRLAEVKGAVELLLADCYARRDRVALLAFRGARADLLLPPTTSLVRAKRCLAALPGGGGTPIAAGLDAAAALAASERRAGRTPLLVVLTDGQANVARDGTADRTRAASDAQAAARRFRALGSPALLIDTAPRPRPQAERLAAEMAARYLPLPFAGSAAALSRTVRGAVAATQ